VHRAVLASALSMVAAASCTVRSGDPASPTSAAPASSPTPALSPTPSPTESQLPKLPAYGARVEGKFVGSGLFDSQVTFSPHCRRGGACDTIGQSKLGGYKFKYAQKSYTADDTFTQTCSSGGLSTGYPISVDFRFRVAKARYIHDVWRATKLSATLRANSPGAKKTVTTSTSINTLTCDATHRTDKGSMTLTGHY
jgi:hypothetical protein